MKLNIKLFFLVIFFIVTTSPLLFAAPPQKCLRFGTQLPVHIQHLRNRTFPYWREKLKLIPPNKKKGFFSYFVEEAVELWNFSYKNYYAPYFFKPLGKADPYLGRKTAPFFRTLHRGWLNHVRSLPFIYKNLQVAIDQSVRSAEAGLPKAIPPGSLIIF